ncbi:RHS repeat domain-containing protein, partial [Stenotrophomonas maltophilia group sp. RNC7]|uniref:RHS repeat domain-containing protein n=1 Tax=Stenotrophomonas maltophilia group sp. RNC7 TaxID=3071467 RepID=UPI0027E00498
YTEVKDMKGSATKYTYDGFHQLKVTEELGKDHKEVITSEHDEMRLVKKREVEIFHVINGNATDTSYKRIENYRYDEYGNLTNYTGPLAQRDQAGYPVDTEHTVIYSYDYERFHSPLSKTWKQDQNTIAQIIYTLDSKGNIVKETKTNGSKGWIVTDFAYDSFGNIRRKETHDANQSFVTNYEYGVDANGVDHKGAYLTKEYSVIDSINAERKYAYDFNTGNLISEIDPKGNRTEYQYDVLGRVVQSTRPDTNTKQYTYNDNAYLNSTVI